MDIEQLIAHMQENKWVYLLEHKAKLGWYLIDFIQPEENGSAASSHASKGVDKVGPGQRRSERMRIAFIACRPPKIDRPDVKERQGSANRLRTKQSCRGRPCPPLCATIRRALARRRVPLAACPPVLVASARIRWCENPFSHQSCRVGRAQWH